MLSVPEHCYKEGGHSLCSTPPGGGGGGLPAAGGLNEGLEVLLCHCSIASSDQKALDTLIPVKVFPESL